MSSQTPHKAASPPTTIGTTFRPLESSSKSDWLATSLMTAKTIAVAAEGLPFPCVKGVLETFVVILETVEKLKKNREDLKELCEDIMDIINVVQGLSAQQDTPIGKFKNRCDEFEGFLQVILAAVEKMQMKPKGLRSHLKDIVKLGSTTETITGYRNRMQELRSNFMLMATIDTNFQIHKVHETLTTMKSNFSVPHATQRTNTCPPPSRIFHGRQIILDEMHHYFFQTTGKQHIYLLYGLGGAGKTQIALKFIEKSYPHFTDTFLIDSSTVETIETGLKNIALAKNIGNSSGDALKWLSSKNDEWLLFIDNADDPKLNLNTFLPQCNHGNILITSRNPELRGYAGSHALISDMEESDAVELLLKSAAQDTTPRNRQTATEIVKVLWYLPLAIIQAGAFILKSGMLNTYLALYATNKDRLLREKPAQSHDDYAWTVYTTWQISFDQLSDQAATLLQLCSFLHCEGISEQIFSYASAYEFEPNGPSKEELQKPFEFLSQFLGPTGVWDPLRFIDVITEIRAYSLINFDTEKQLFSIHPLVHNWSRTTLQNEELYHHCMVAIVGMSIGVMPKTNMQVDSLRLLPHIDSLLNGNMHMTPDFGTEYGHIYYYTQKHRQAETLEVAVLEKRRMILGDNHLETLSAMNNLAMTYRSMGKLGKAEELQVMVLEKYRMILGEDHPKTLIAMNNLAMTYHSLGKLTKAEKLQVTVLEKRRNVLGEDHPETLNAMGNLGKTYNASGKWKEGEELLVILLEKQQNFMDKDHPATVVTMGTLANTYFALGKLKEAVELQVLVLNKSEKILGKNHPHTHIARDALTLTSKALDQSNRKEV